MHLNKKQSQIEEMFKKVNKVKKPDQKQEDPAK